MKSLRESLLDDDLIDKTDKMIKDEIKSFLKENYNGVVKISKKPNADGKYEVSSTKKITVKNRNITSLTNGMFVWTVVRGTFGCDSCYSLTSLEGAPKEVGEHFYCDNCYSLKSLEGAPEKVGGSFSCYGCNSLTSLEGAPKEAGEAFHCSGCKSLKTLKGAPQMINGGFSCHTCNSLTSLEGAPEKVGGNFGCDSCNSLTSLEGAPKEVGGRFYCNNCAGKFTEDDVKKISNVKKDIIC